MTDTRGRRRPVHPDVLADMASAYAAGASIRAISAEYGGSYCWVRLRLIGAGVTLRSRGGYQERRDA